MLHNKYLLDKKIFKLFSLSMENKWPPGRGHFLSHGYNWNIVGRGPLDDVTYQISKARPSSFRQEDFLKKILYESMENKWPPGRGHFWPQGYNLNNLSSGPQWCYIPNIKGLGLLLLDKKIFKVFSVNESMKNKWPPEWGHLDPRGIIWTSLVEVH